MPKAMDEKDVVVVKKTKPTLVKKKVVVVKKTKPTVKVCGCLRCRLEGVPLH